MPKQIIYLLKYNNYYNRIIKGYDNVEGYIDNETIVYRTPNPVNFNPNDGINTRHDLNCGNVDVDYLLCYDTSKLELSRWFIMEMTRLANGQYRLQLRRDLIQDFKSDVINAPSFIEKATARANDPAIYNNENMSFNQIKKDERLIQDETRIPWIVGYIPRKTFMENKTILSQTPINLPANIEVSTLSAWEFGNMINELIAYGISYETQMRFVNVVGERSTRTYHNIGTFTATSTNVEQATSGFSNFNGTYRIRGTIDNLSEFQKIIAPLQTPQYQAEYDAWMRQHFDNVSTADQLQAINGKILKTTDNGYCYKINVTDTYLIPGDTTQTAYDLTDVMVNYANSNIDRSTIVDGNSTDKTWQMTANVSIAKITLEQVFASVGVDIAANHNELLDAPYDMFCVPYGSIRVRTEALSSFDTNKEAGLNMVSSIVEELGQGAVFDIQLLPYCPCRELLNATQGTLDAYKGSFSTIYFNDSAKARLNVLIWCQYSQFSLTRIYSGATNQGILFDYDYPDPVEKKVKNETEFLRICSPNYDGAFDFTPAKNNGFSGFNIDCVYRPFTPYIHVNPIFNKGSLYGNNFKDARGLICGGDFSLTQMTDAWATYQLNNKNYQATFDRNIESIELKNRVQGTMDVVNAITGTLSGAVTGGMTGSMMGAGPYSAAAGAVAGGIASGAGGVADVTINKILREDALDLTKDQFGYNLQNIQAIPQSLRKVTAFNPNNKIFPFVEYYACSSIEVEALRNKIKYNGMTIMRIGTIVEFIQEEPSYIKGKLIRLENVGDNHLVAEISSELNQGIFI